MKNNEWISWTEPERRKHANDRWLWIGIKMVILCRFVVAVSTLILLLIFWLLLIEAEKYSDIYDFDLKLFFKNFARIIYM